MVVRFSSIEMSGTFPKGEVGAIRQNKEQLSKSSLEDNQFFARVVASLLAWAVLLGHWFRQLSLIKFFSVSSNPFGFQIFLIGNPQELPPILLNFYTSYMNFGFLHFFVCGPIPGSETGNTLPVPAKVSLWRRNFSRTKVIGGNLYAAATGGDQRSFCFTRTSCYTRSRNSASSL
ncbi:hypothetical protein RvY_06932-1 [Ramazzottius varieornatus]|uniref:Uncharacterized protein n=1 Tax=Ramazzottius varieornatus TaxID=947166 RepID=A0A1D1V0B1_RAMVA|nr:hypothetical protein RvY_06932-1 [Ramazzottius varieornatus]